MSSETRHVFIRYCDEPGCETAVQVVAATEAEAIAAIHQQNPGEWTFDGPDGDRCVEHQT